jgi:hypothetical protein
MKTIQKDRYPLADELEKSMQLHGFTFEIGPSMAYDQYGNEYTTLRMEGPFEEGRKEFLKVRASTENMACMTYEKSLFKFLGKNRHVIWRIRPEVDGMSDGWHEEWEVYSRLTAYPERAK